MRFQANPDGTILPQYDIELLCEASFRKTLKMKNLS
jgi:hypothetical protein